MVSDAVTKLAVLGSPIDHSLSPLLHAGAYRQLGLPWSYEAIDVDMASLADFLHGLGPEWRGLSVTMPLKRHLVSLLDGVDRVVELSGVANTVVLGDHRTGFNTDVAGLVRAFNQHSVHELSEVMVLGGGATATSALLACYELGAHSLRFWVRDPSRSVSIRRLARELGLNIEVNALTELEGVEGHPDAVISTIPNGATVDLLFSTSLRRTAVLFDVAYDPWPSALATSWHDAGGQTISGIEMLINQALIQVRLFVSGDPEQELPDEPAVFAAMRASLPTS